MKRNVPKDKQERNNFLQPARERAGLARERFAEIVGCDPTSIYKKEKSLRPLTLTEVRDYSFILGCTEEEIIFGAIKSAPIINIDLFQSCSAALDRGLAFMGIDDLTPQEYARAVAKAYNAGIEGGYAVPVIDKTYIEKTIEELREIA